MQEQHQGAVGGMDACDLASRVCLVQGDALEAPLEGATVVWCAVRPRFGRKIGARLAERLRRALQPGCTARLLLAGFELPTRVEGVELRSAYMFEAAAGADTPSDDPQVLQLYGGKLGGPSVILEYHVTAHA